MKFGLGQSIPRTEDPKFLTGRARYTDDIDLAGQLHAWFVRSPHAHAAVTGIDADAARAVPGFVAMITAADLHAAGVGGIACKQKFPGVTFAPRPALASVARHVGEPVALVLATSRAAARDAAEAVVVAYDARPAAIGFAHGEPAFTWEQGDAAVVDRAFAAAAHRFTHTTRHNRVVPFPMEPRAAIAAADGGRLTLYAQTQGAHEFQADLATALNLPLSAIRVVTPDVGGGFGARIHANPEHIAIAHAARVLGRAVKWLGERGECMLSDNAGRGHETVAEIALDEDFRIVGLRFRWKSDLGAYAAIAGPAVPTVSGSRVVTGCYAIPVQHVLAEGRFTNTVPVCAYRGAGKPEANFAIEAAIDACARRFGLDAMDLRRRNLVRPGQMPFTNAMGQVFDSGDFPGLLDAALALSDGFAARAEAAQARGEILGRGIGLYVEPSGMRDQRVGVSFRADGSVLVTSTAQSNGQGHETALAQIVAARLGIDLERIQVVQGDSDITVAGSGTGGSRSITVGGAAVLRAAEMIEAKARRIAAHLLEAAEADLVLEDGAIAVAGTDRHLTLETIAAVAFDPTRLPPGEDLGLEATHHHRQAVANFPSGCHVAEVALDPETGAVRLTGYWAVNDFGTVINPALLAGQVQGGVAQAIGQALVEDQAFDPGSGQVLAGSLMDYALPRASGLPGFTLADRPTRCATNPLGMKGCGEAGCAGGLGAMANALADALARAGAEPAPFPATPARVFAALAARATGGHEVLQGLGA
jgi:carbon-monoxide dehydrogenase large subunit